ncbi:MAG: carboxymuconolactone decarboxylase family protein, partial [Pseudomonadota bacterium]
PFAERGRQRELIGAPASTLTGCEYCAGAHAETARLLGVAAGVLEALVEDVGPAPVDDKLRPLLAYLLELTVTPVRMVQADADAGFAAGWDEDRLHDAIAVVALFTFMNSLLLGHGVMADETQFAPRGRRDFKEGYLRQHPELYGG